MILIADSGSTKTDWRLIVNKSVNSQYKTLGLNPYLVDETVVETKLKEELQLSVDNNSIEQIYFYGSGCSNTEKSLIIKRSLLKLFPKADIIIEHDLLAAARALCHNNDGIVSILGTGSNSCYFNGKAILKNVSSLGYILGDEGSGSYMGKKLLQYYLNEELPSELNDKFFAHYKIGKDEILDAIYKKPFPNKYMAGFTHFLFRNLDHPFVVQLVSESINDFFVKHICKYDNHKHVPFHSTGSIGFYFNTILRNVAQSHHVQVGNIVESPIAALTNYHLEQL